jgi:hypothetical protein
MCPRAVVIGLFGALAAAPALAGPPQQGLPTRIDNVYNGTAHEPDAAATQARERNAGIAPPPAVQRNETHTVEQLDRQLEGNQR